MFYYRIETPDKTEYIVVETPEDAEAYAEEEHGTCVEITEEEFKRGLGYEI